MKTRVFLAFSLGVCGLSLIALTANPQIISSSPGETEPSRCLSEAAIQVTANPTSVVLGQSSTVSWSVQVPSGCAGVQVKFNGQSVARSGSQSVTPPRTSRFTVTVGESHLGVHGQKRQSVEVGVSYPPVVVINPSTQKPVQVLIGALVDSINEQQTVELCATSISI